MSNWEQTHRRYNLVYSVADAVALRGPVAVEEWREPIEREFGDVAGFLRDVQRRWYTAVDAYLDVVLEDEPADMSVAVAEIVQHVSETDRQLRVVLDAFANDPVLAAGDAYHRRALLALTGVDQDALVPVQAQERASACSRFLGAARRAFGVTGRVSEPAA